MQLSSKTVLGLTSLQLDIVLLVEVLKVFAFIACLSNVEDLPFQNSPKRDLGGLGDLTAFNASKPGSPLSSEASLRHCVFMTLVMKLSHRDNLRQRLQNF